MITFPLYKDDITYDEAAKNLQLNRKLVATAKASVSSAFENLCDSGQLITHIDKMESKLISELNAIKEMVLKMEATILD
ncbi:hypothetical protein O3M35_001552 [Rhynocoris fuscipes]|uniref:Uncharacterized protein n=1 Tax=Rhynocoris fuscipes TaxID=488301 RepID=A0AAW1CVF1_9HEMI